LTVQGPAFPPQNDEALVDGLLERLGAGGGRVFSVAPAALPDGSTGEGAGGGRLLEHLGWPCSLRMALLVSMHMQITVSALEYGEFWSVAKHRMSNFPSEEGPPCFN
jgi:hypothetical protein